MEARGWHLSMCALFHDLHIFEIFNSNNSEHFGITRNGFRRTYKSCSMKWSIHQSLSFCVFCGPPRLSRHFRPSMYDICRKILKKKRLIKSYICSSLFFQTIALFVLFYEEYDSIILLSLINHPPFITYGWTPCTRRLHFLKTLFFIKMHTMTHL